MRLNTKNKNKMPRKFNFQDVSDKTFLSLMHFNMYINKNGDMEIRGMYLKKDIIKIHHIY